MIRDPLDLTSPEDADLFDPDSATSLMTAESEDDPLNGDDDDEDWDDDDEDWDDEDDDSEDWEPKRKKKDEEEWD